MKNTLQLLIAILISTTTSYSAGMILLKNGAQASKALIVTTTINLENMVKATTASGRFPHVLTWYELIRKCKDSEYIIKNDENLHSMRSWNLDYQSEDVRNIILSASVLNRAGMPIKLQSPVALSNYY